LYQGKSGEKWKRKETLPALHAGKGSRDLVAILTALLSTLNNPHCAYVSLVSKQNDIFEK
jgi:hypothetical protein